MGNEIVLWQNFNKKKVRSDGTWGLIWKIYLNKEIEDLVFSTQEQTVKTNWIILNIDGFNRSLDCKVQRASLERIQTKTCQYYKKT